jgi:hypothetical protein
MKKRARKKYLFLTTVMWASVAVTGRGHAQTDVVFGLSAGSTSAPPAGLSLGGGESSEGVFDTFQVSSLTLTGEVAGTSQFVRPRDADELKRRLQAALDAKNYRLALEYASVPVIAGPQEQALLLKAKATAQLNLNRVPDAIATMRGALALTPNDVSIVYDLAEMMLINGRIDEYRAFAAKYKEQINKAYSGTLAKYLAVLEAYQTMDKEQFRNTVVKILRTLPAHQGALLPGWDFGGLLEATAKQPPSRQKVMLLTFVRFLTGELSQDEALAVMQEM